MQAVAQEEAAVRDATAPASPARVFVALKMAQDIAHALAELARPLEKFSVRPISPGDIHLTLVPPWAETATEAAADRLRHAVEGCRAFTLEFRHLGYGPDPKRPRLLWVDCAMANELVELNAALVRVFGRPDDRPFRPHVTLARLRNNGRRIARQCPLDRELTLMQAVTTVELMQSPPPGARGYRILASVPLVAVG
ncbi:MAG: RNA 2',3'-cyclic phosphodiesterase [Pseudolabrys sp.]